MTYKKVNSIFEEIKGLVINSKNKIYTTINTEMLNLYWHIGKIMIFCYLRMFKNFTKQ